MTEYPHDNGDVTVLGPEVFVTQDGSVLCWQGRNYVPQDDARLRTAVETYLRIHAEHESIGDLVDAGDYHTLREWGEREHAAFHALQETLDASPEWVAAEEAGWRRENDRHRALYVEAAKERDQLRVAATDVWAVLFAADRVEDEVELLTPEHAAMLPEVVRAAFIAANEVNGALEAERDRMRLIVEGVRSMLVAADARDEEAFVDATDYVQVELRLLDGSDLPNG